MKNPFRLTFRSRGRGSYCCVDTRTGKRTSLGRLSKQEARRIVDARNEAERQPALNLQLARAYLCGSDPRLSQRTWGEALQILSDSKNGANRDRWLTVAKDRALKRLLPLPIMATDSEKILKVIQTGSVSTNVFLRRLHNFCVDMNWLPVPLVPKRQWPAVRYGDKRAVTWDEHCRIIERETNPERKAFYQMAWHLGASQTDLACLQAEDIDWESSTISFFRAKTKWRSQTPPQIRFGKEVERILSTLPQTGRLFPYLASVRSSDRATEFRQRCAGLGISGVTLHSYRYAWAERAKQAGYPERFAQLALGHNSKAVHRAYARQAQVTIPPLEEYEAKILAFPAAGSIHTTNAAKGARISK